MKFIAFCMEALADKLIYEVCLNFLRGYTYILASNIYAETTLS